MSDPTRIPGPGGRAVRWAKTTAIALCLFAPSVWMIATIPPLWRDADAYIQLTQDPRVATFWGHAPAYCYIAKIPLFAGQQWERLRGLPPAPRIVESQLPLTDSGIGILIVAQHLALGIAAFRFIAAVTSLFWVRFALALVWASNAMTYTFAHCVGSETLGMILAIGVATKAIRLVQENEPGWKQWYGFAVLLLLSLLSRDLNLTLIALLPLAFLLSWVQSKLRRRRQVDAAPSPALRHAITATAIGLACLVSAGSLTQNLARKTKLHPHSRIGFTFLWRLHFLNDLSAESRAALLQKVKARAPSERVRYLITLLEQFHAESPDLIVPTTLMQRAIGYFGGHLHWEDLDRALNQMAFTFLLPPPAELLHAARNDFLLGLETPSTAISEYVFLTTTYYFGNKEEIPGCGDLATFRSPMSPEKIMQSARHPYFRLWRGVSYLHVSGVWLAAVVLLLFLARRRQKQAGTLLSFGTALLLTGLAQFVASCLLHDYEPRFSLAMWLLLLCSVFVLIGGSSRFLRAGESAAA